MGQTSYIGARINASAKMATGRFQGGSVAIKGTAGQNVKEPKKSGITTVHATSSGIHYIETVQKKIRQKSLNRPRPPMMAGSKCGADERKRRSSR